LGPRRFLRLIEAVEDHLALEADLVAAEALEEGAVFPLPLLAPELLTIIEGVVVAEETIAPVNAGPGLKAASHRDRCQRETDGDPQAGVGRAETRRGHESLLMMRHGSPHDPVYVPVTAEVIASRTASSML
jgi:hypothetical protein